MARRVSDDIIDQALEGVDRALLEAAYALGKAAQRNMPVGDPSQDPDVGTALRDSINIAPLPGGHSVRVSVDTPYAAKQEFDLRLQHPRGGGARYMGRALAEIAPRLDSIVAGKVRGKMQGRTRGF